MKLDLTAAVDDLNVLNEDIAKKAGIDVGQYNQSLNSLKKATVKVNKKIENINKRFANAKTEKEKDALRKEGRELNLKLHEAFKYIQDHFIGIELSSTITTSFAQYQENIELFNDIIQALEKGNISNDKDGALDLAWHINGGSEYGFYDFSVESNLRAQRRLSEETNPNNVFWTTNRQFKFAKTYPALLGIFEKAEQENPDFADVRSLEGVAPTTNKCVPIIAVPTTAGTAAEVTINYVITDTEKNRKMVCVDPKDIPVVAVVDPDMMSSMPKGLTAATGMDALTHAIEGYITAGAWELSDMFHLKAIEIISRSLRGAVENTPEGREGMALGQYVAGMGFSNVGLGIVHSMAHPLGALYDTPHGVANAIILPTVMEYNAPATGEKYRNIAKAMGVEGVDEMTLDEARKAAVDAVKKLSHDVGIPENLKDIVKPEDVDFLAQSAYDDACRPGNPRETSVEEIKELYLSLM